MDHVHDAAADATNIILRVFMPFFIMFITSVVMSKNLMRSKNKFTSMSQNNQSGDLPLKKEHQFIITIISMNILYLILFLPRSIAFLFSVIYTFHSTLEDIKIVLGLNLFRIVSECIAFINNFSVFFTSLAFNNLFRSELFDVFSAFKKEFNKIKIKNISASKS